MKHLISVLVCVIGSVVVSADEMNNEAPKRMEPPVGLKHPNAYPPGPEREAARKRLAEWTQHLEAKIQARRKAQKDQEEKDRLADPNEGPFLRELAKVTDTNGTVHVGRMPEWAQQRAHAMVTNPKAAKQWGPSKEFVEIVGQRRAEELVEILQVVQDSALVARRPAGRQLTLEQRVKLFRHQMRPSIQITDEQIRKLLSVEPIWSLWSQGQ